MKRLWQRTGVMVVPLITTISYFRGINSVALMPRNWTFINGKMVNYVMYSLPQNFNRKKLKFLTENIEIIADSQAVVRNNTEKSLTLYPISPMVIFCTTTRMLALIQSTPILFRFLCFTHTCVHAWRRRRHPTPALLPGKAHGWRSLVGCSPQGR